MAQITLPFTLTAGTPENVNNVQSNFVQIKDHINNALIGTDNITDASLLDTDLASPNNSVPRTVHAVGGSYINAATAAGTYFLIPGNSVQSASGSVGYATPTWIPNTADVAVAGKTTQVRLVAYLLVNATAPAVNVTVGLNSIASIAGGAGAMTFTLNAASATAVFAAPVGGGGYRGTSSWISLPSALAHCLTVAPSGTTVANSLVSITAALEMRHN